MSYSEHIELLKDIEEKNREISMLRTESGIAREAVDRYCPPELMPSAREWLKSRGL